MKKPQRSPEGSQVRCLLHAYSTPSSCKEGRALPPTSTHERQHSITRAGACQGRAARRKRAWQAAEHHGLTTRESTRPHLQAAQLSGRRHPSQRIPQRVVAVMSRGGGARRLLSILLSRASTLPATCLLDMCLSLHGSHQPPHHQARSRWIERRLNHPPRRQRDGGQ